VSGSEDAKIYVWDLQSREVLQVLEGHRGIFL
jgi:COMPASS component SWD3